MGSIEGYDVDRPEVVVLLADAAQVSEGKLHLLGGGLSLVGPRPQPVSIALLVSVPWDRAGVVHRWRLELLDEDGVPVMHDDRPLIVQGNLQAGRPADQAPGTPLQVPLAINFSALPVRPGHRYAWRLSIDDDTEPGWQATFGVRPLPPATA